MEKKNTNQSVTIKIIGIEPLIVFNYSNVTKLFFKRQREKVELLRAKGINAGICETCGMIIK